MQPFRPFDQEFPTRFHGRTWPWAFPGDPMKMFILFGWSLVGPVGADRKATKTHILQTAELLMEKGFEVRGQVSCRAPVVFFFSLFFSETPHLPRSPEVAHFPVKTEPSVGFAGLGNQVPKEATRKKGTTQTIQISTAWATPTTPLDQMKQLCGFAIFFSNQKRRLTDSCIF